MNDGSVSQKKQQSCTKLYPSTAVHIKGIFGLDFMKCILINPAVE